MATLEMGTTLKQPLTSTVTLRNSVEILTRKTTYLKNTSETTGRLTGREEWERESATICNAMISKQSTDTLATKSQKGPANPRMVAPHVTYCNR